MSDHPLERHRLVETVPLLQLRPDLGGVVGVITRTLRTPPKRTGFPPDCKIARPPRPTYTAAAAVRPAPCTPADADPARTRRAMKMTQTPELRPAPAAKVRWPAALHPA
jgi:hypothetical protein